jgi:uncharacterized protein (TIGR01777 family)
MKIAIAGGNGFIGSALCSLFLERQDQLYILSRQPRKLPSREGITYVSWLQPGDRPELLLDGVDVFINLAGVSLSSGRWTSVKKKAIRSSRETTTREVVRIIHAMKKKPEVLLQASAVGYYGISRVQSFTEEDIVPPSDFLSTTVHDWEQEALKSGIRTVFMRFGVVLGINGGAFPRIKLPYTMFAGGRLGQGKQPLAWIHIEDAARAVLHCINTVELEGPVNFTAPEMVTMDQFGSSLAKAMHRPHWFPVPGSMLRLLLGEMSILLLEGQYVRPAQLARHGFSFKYGDVNAALTQLVQQR